MPCSSGATVESVEQPWTSIDPRTALKRTISYGRSSPQVGGKKQLVGHTDLDIAITNQCGRLIANIVIAYNSVLLSALLERYQAAGDQKAILLLRKISPVAWQHIHFLGRYMFRDSRHPIDLNTLLANVVLA